MKFDSDETTTSHRRNESIVLTPISTQQPSEGVTTLKTKLNSDETATSQPTNGSTVLTPTSTQEPSEGLKTKLDFDETATSHIINGFIVLTPTASQQSSEGAKTITTKMESDETVTGQTNESPFTKNSTLHPVEEVTTIKIDLDETVASQTSEFLFTSNSTQQPAEVVTALTSNSNSGRIFTSDSTHRGVSTQRPYLFSSSTILKDKGTAMVSGLTGATPTSTVHTEDEVLSTSLPSTIVTSTSPAALGVDNVALTSKSFQRTQSSSSDKHPDRVTNELLHSTTSSDLVFQENGTTLHELDESAAPTQRDDGHHFNLKNSVSSLNGLLEVLTSHTSTSIPTTVLTKLETLSTTATMKTFLPVSADDNQAASPSSTLPPSTSEVDEDGNISKQVEEKKVSLASTVTSGATTASIRRRYHRRELSSIPGKPSSETVTSEPTTASITRGYHGWKPSSVPVELTSQTVTSEQTTASITRGYHGRELSSIPRKPSSETVTSDPTTASITRGYHGREPSSVPGKPSSETVTSEPTTASITHRYHEREPSSVSRKPSSETVTSEPTTVPITRGYPGGEPSSVPVNFSSETVTSEPTTASITRGYHETKPSSVPRKPSSETVTSEPTTASITRRYPGGEPSSVIGKPSSETVTSEPTTASRTRRYPGGEPSSVPAKPSSETVTSEPTTVPITRRYHGREPSSVPVNLPSETVTSEPTTVPITRRYHGREPSSVPVNLPSETVTSEPTTVPIIRGYHGREPSSVPVELQSEAVTSEPTTLSITREYHGKKPSSVPEELSSETVSSEPTTVSITRGYHGREPPSVPGKQSSETVTSGQITSPTTRRYRGREPSSVPVELSSEKSAPRSFVSRSPTRITSVPLDTTVSLTVNEHSVSAQEVSTYDSADTTNSDPSISHTALVSGPNVSQDTRRTPSDKPTTAILQIIGQTVKRSSSSPTEAYSSSKLFTTMPNLGSDSFASLKTSIPEQSMMLKTEYTPREQEVTVPGNSESQPQIPFSVRPSRKPRRTSPDLLSSPTTLIPEQGTARSVRSTPHTSESQSTPKLDSKLHNLDLVNLITILEVLVDSSRLMTSGKVCLAGIANQNSWSDLTNTLRDLERSKMIKYTLRHKFETVVNVSDLNPLLWWKVFTLAAQYQCFTRFQEKIQIPQNFGNQMEVGTNSGSSHTAQGTIPNQLPQPWPQNKEKPSASVNEASLHSYFASRSHVAIQQRTSALNSQKLENVYYISGPVTFNNAGNINSPVGYVRPLVESATSSGTDT